MSIIIFATWIIFNVSMVNIAIKLGWGHDPGYIAPLILVLLVNLTLAIYGTRTKTETSEDS